MSDQSDMDGVLHRFVTRDQAERLLAAEPGDVPNVHGLADVATLFAAMRAPATTNELVGAESALTAFTAAIREGTSPALSARRKPKLTKFLTGKAIAALATATVLSGGAAAAAMGGLPNPVQDGVAKTFSHIGMNLPDSHEGTDDTHGAVDTTRDGVDTTRNAVDDAHNTVGDDAPTTTEASTAAVGPDAEGAAKKGLCTAYAASSDSSGKNLDSVAFRNLADAASKAGRSIEEYCADVTTTTAPDDHGQSGQNNSTDDNGRPADAGKPDDTGKPADAGKPDNTGKDNSQNADKADKGESR